MTLPGKYIGMAFSVNSLSSPPSQTVDSGQSSDESVRPGLRSVIANVWHKLQALDCDILPPTTAVTGYTVWHKPQALDCDILPPTTALVTTTAVTAWLHRLTQTPSAGLWHPASNHRSNWLLHRSPKTGSYRTVFRWCSNGSKFVTDKLNCCYCWIA